MSESCPTPTKATYPDDATARLAGARLAADRRGPRLTPYACPCGNVHLTSGDSLAARTRKALAR